MKARFIPVVAITGLLASVFSVQSAYAASTCFGEYHTSNWTAYDNRTWTGTTGHNVFVGGSLNEGVYGSRTVDSAIDQWDSICGNYGIDQLVGYGGGDKLSGGSGSDLLSGFQGADWLQGDSGNDNLYGGVDNDSLYGGTGDDVLVADAGNDYIQDSGGTGDRDIVCDGPGSNTVNIKDGDNNDKWYIYGDGYSDTATYDSGDWRLVAACPTFTWPR